MEPSGYLLFEDSERAVIVTLESENTKTGNMAQMWILCRDVHPVEAVKTGADSAVCGDCPHRGTACYVEIGKSPAAVWRKYQRGGYPALPMWAYGDVFGGREVRFGAYGDPYFVPVEILNAVAAASERWTGYTHQWRVAPEELKRLVMASVDSPEERAAAEAAGWRTFRVRTEDQPLEAGEIVCPASDEGGNRCQCIDCTLCDGRKRNDPRKSVAILVHGRGKAKFTPALIQIAA